MNRKYYKPNFHYEYTSMYTLFQTLITYSFNQLLEILKLCNVVQAYKIMLIAVCINSTLKKICKRIAHESLTQHYNDKTIYIN